MFLVTAATDFEMEALLRVCPPTAAFAHTVTGVGPVESAVKLTAYLATTTLPIGGVVNIGLAGAYLLDDGDSAGLLDICLAEREVLADLGICCGAEVKQLRGAAFELVDTFEMDTFLLLQAEELLKGADIPYRQGTFATVNCVSGDRQRGEMLARRHKALCENMEGAAVARACRHFGLPLLELRCISNLVEDRHLQDWQLQPACRRCGEVAALVLTGLCHA